MTRCCGDSVCSDAVVSVLLRRCLDDVSISKIRGVTKSRMITVGPNSFCRRASDSLAAVNKTHRISLHAHAQAEKTERKNPPYHSRLCRRQTTKWRSSADQAASTILAPVVDHHQTISVQANRHAEVSSPSLNKNLRSALRASSGL